MSECDHVQPSKVLNQPYLSLNIVGILQKPAAVLCLIDFINGKSLPLLSQRPSLFYFVTTERCEHAQNRMDYSFSVALITPLCRPPSLTHKCALVTLYVLQSGVWS